MLPLMPGPDPTAFGAIAVALTIGAGGAVLAFAGLLGWTAVELVCLIEHYGEA